MWTNKITLYKQIFDGNYYTTGNLNNLENPWLIVSLGASYTMKHFCISNRVRSKYIFHINHINV